MNPQRNVKGNLGCLVVAVGVILLVTILTVASFNPLDVFARGRPWAKVTVGFLAAVAVLALLQVIMQGLAIKVLSASAKMPAEDVRCPGCGEPLLAFIGAYGRPIRCLGCGTWRHNGPACSGTGNRVQVLTRCTVCPSADTDNRDLMEGGFPY